MEFLQPVATHRPSLLFVGGAGCLHDQVNCAAGRQIDRLLLVVENESIGDERQVDLLERTVAARSSPARSASVAPGDVPKARKYFG